MSTAKEIVAEIATAKTRFFDAHLVALGHVDALDADISPVVVPESDWLAGYFADPVRFSVATRKDSLLDGRFMATIEFDLTRRMPNVTVNAVVMLADGTCRSCNVDDRPKSDLASWEIAVMEARWSVQFAMMAARVRLGIPAKAGRPEKPQRELSFFAAISGRKTA